MKTRDVFDKVHRHLPREVTETLVAMNDRILAAHEANKNLANAYSKLVDEFGVMVAVAGLLKKEYEALEKKMGIAEQEKSDGLSHPQLPQTDS